MQKYTFLYTFIISLICTLCFSQTGDLHGVLKIKESGTQATFSTITISDSNFKSQSISNHKGEYQITNIPYGTYTITITSLETSDFKSIIEIKSASRKMDFELEKSNSKNVDEVVIEQKSKKQTIESSGFAVNVIDTQKAALQSIQTNELLDRSAGVRIRQEGGLGSRINYNINGMSGNAVRIFIDGIPSSNFGNSFSLNSIPPSLIERIEVFKGVVPASLSDDALGGAINIVMKNKNRNSLTTSYSYGSFNTHQWNMNGSHRWKNGLILDGSAFYNYSDNNYEVWGKDITFKDYNGTTYQNKKAKRFHDAYQSYGAKATLGFTNKKWAERFFIGGIFSEDYKEIQHGITMSKVYGDRHTRRNSKTATLNYLKKDILIDGLSLKIDASYSNLKRQAIDTVGIMYDWRGPIKTPEGNYVRYTSGSEVGSTKTDQTNTDKTLVTRTNLSYKINDYNNIQVNYLFNDFKRGVYDSYLPLDLRKLQNTKDLQKNILSFTYENLAFNEKLRSNIFYKNYSQKTFSNDPYREDIVPGVPNYEVKVSEKSMQYDGYGMTLAYEINPKVYILASAEKTIRMPEADELFGNATANLLAPVGGMLNPEVSYNANIGLNLGKFAYKNHAIKLNTSIFYRDTRGMIREAISSGSFEFSRFENLENVLSKGIDAEINYDYANQFFVNLNISKFEVLFNTKYDQNGAPYLFYKTQIRNEPSFKYNLNLSWIQNNLIQEKSVASFYYNLSYVEKFLRNWANVGGKNLDIIPTQISNDIGFTYTFPSQKWSLSFDAKNILNNQNFDNFGLQKPGRAFYSKITYIII